MKSATRVTLLTFGVLMGLAGVEHGIGEILQGSIAPSGLIFPSWPGSAFFSIVGGEPAMTIVPNLLVTGILAILFSSAFAVWACLFAARKNAARVLILLSGAMLLVGGGIFPPIIGFMLGILATRINAPFKWRRAHSSATLWHLPANIWPWAFGVCVIAWLLLFPGINILGYFFGVNNPPYTVMVILFALAALLVTVVTGFAQDIERMEK